ncbi:MAG TPA: SpoIIE family protein phosphatase [Anaerolineales bacterium]|nr:SpoIIE family protein phosphatase [Anaerolineales bacterium]
MVTQPNHLLVVDDNQVNRMLLIHNLEQQGHCVMAAANGCEALELLQTRQIDLVLLDIEMPEMNGYQVLSTMKRDTQMRHIPVLMVTAVDEMESAIHCIEMGAEDYLPKPFNPVLLRARISASLDKKHLRDKEQLYLKSLERELEIGREIQAGFLPKRLPKAPGWEIVASLKSAKEVAGDFYDAFYLASEQKICLVIADVCDKGVGAALFMTLFRSLLRFTIGVTDTFGEHSPAARLKYAVTLTNSYIADTHGDTGMFATIFIGLLDPKTGSLTYINAGHESPLIISINGSCTPLKKTGPVVGVFPDIEFGVAKTRLGLAELFFAFTDGAPDALDLTGNSFSRERLISSLRYDVPAGILLADINAKLEKHIGEAEQFDDITFLIIRRAAEFSGKELQTK